MRIFILMLLIISISTWQFTASNLPVSPLTRSKSIHACNKLFKELTITCDLSHRIRIIEAFYGVSSLLSSDDYCSKGYQEKDCKNYTNLQRECNGKLKCKIFIQESYLSTCGNTKSQYLQVQYECIPDSKVHNICGRVRESSSWGTLQTPNLLNNQNCWCKLQSEKNQRILLSVIDFNLKHNNCYSSGLYLQSERKRSKDCTFLQQTHYYISSSDILYLNYNSQNVTQNDGFWIIYEASDVDSKININCGETIESTPTTASNLSQRKPIFKISTTSRFILLTTTMTTIKRNEKLISTTLATSKIPSVLQVFNKNTTLKSPFNFLIKSTTQQTAVFTTTARPNHEQIFEKLNLTNNFIYEMTTKSVSETSVNTTIPYLDEIEISDYEMNETNKSEIISTVGFLDSRKKQLLERKSSGSFERKLSKTELAIIISCIGFIIALTLTNLIVYAIQKLSKKNKDNAAKNNLNSDDKNSYDILPGVGEIILWAAKDKRGYLIDINGSWAKIDGQRWIRENMTVLHNTYKKASMAYKNRFKKKEKLVQQQHVTTKREDDRLITSNNNININNHSQKGHTPKNVPEASSEYEATSSASSTTALTNQVVYENDQFFNKEQSKAFETDTTESTCYQEGQYNSILASDTENMKIEASEQDIFTSHKQGRELTLTHQHSIQIREEADHFHKYQNETSCSDSESTKPKHDRPAPLQRNSPDIILPCTNLSSVTKYPKQPVAIVAPNKSLQSTLDKAQINEEMHERRVHFTNDATTIEIIESRLTNEDLKRLLVAKHKEVIVANVHTIKMNPNNERDSGFLEEKTTSSRNNPTMEETCMDDLTSTIDKTTSFVVCNSTLDSTDSNWMRRQVSPNEGDLIENEPPEEPSQRADTDTLDDATSDTQTPLKSTHFNSDEFKFFINAVEKLKATSLFCDDDLKKMSDEQIYEALIEHARKQRLKSSLNTSTNSSTAKDEEDLPIIMKNLHSVKSLKHYFEIKSREANGVEPIKVAKHIESKIDDLDRTHASETREVSVQTDAPKSSVIPDAPPLPNFLFESNLKSSKSLPSTTFKIKSECVSSSEYYSTPSLTETKNLRDRLIREIHNKSMERSRKDANISLDEHGNLIGKASNRVFTSSKPQKLFKTKVEVIKSNKKFTKNSLTDEINQNAYENDQVTELNSISQVPSVCPTLDRFDKTNDEVKRTTSFRSDLSVSSSAISTRSMLLEAKVKLESMKMAKSKLLFQQKLDELTHF